MKDYSCEDARRWLATLTDRGKDLPTGLHFHLTQCDDCRGVATDYQAALSAYRTVTNDDLMIPRFAAVREATRTNIKARRAWSWLDWLQARWMWVAIPVAVAGLILIVSVLARGGAGDPGDGAWQPHGEPVAAARGGGADVVSPLIAQSSGVVLGEGQALVSAREETLSAAGESTLVVEAASELLVQRWRPDAAIFRLERGTVRASVVKRRPGQRFEVRTREAVVSVRGTAFSVRRDERGTEVTVEHGKVEVEPLTGGRAWVTLTAGQRWHSAPSAAPNSEPLPAKDEVVVPTDGPVTDSVTEPVAPKLSKAKAPSKSSTRSTRPTTKPRVPHAQLVKSKDEASKGPSAAPKPMAGGVTTGVQGSVEQARQFLADREDTKARAILEGLVKSGRGGATALALLGDAKRIGKDLDGATRAYEDALKVAAKRLRARVLADLAAVQTQSGKASAAAETWRRYLAAAPKGRARAKAHLAVAASAKSWPEAEEHLKAVLDDHPKSRHATRAMERLGRKLTERGRYNEASQLFGAHTRSSSRRRAEGAYLGLMRVYRAQGQTSAARRLWTAYQQRFPTGKRAAEMKKLAGE